MNFKVLCSTLEIFRDVISDCFVFFCFECLSFCHFCLWVHTDSRPVPTESGLSLQPPWLLPCLAFREGGKGTCYVPLGCSSSQSAGLRGEEHVCKIAQRTAVTSE